MKGRIMKHDNIDDAIVNAVYVLTWRVCEEPLAAGEL